VVLVGSNDDAIKLHTMLRSEPELGYAVVAVIGECREESIWGDLPSSPSVADIPELAGATGATGIVVVPYAVSSATTRRAIALAAEKKLHVQVWPGFGGVGSRRLRSVPVSGEPFFYVEPRSLSRWQLAAKRVIDVVGAATALAIAAPVLAIAAIAIKLEDRGPVLHRGERVGLHGKQFVAYKLRSMSSAGTLPPDALACLNERTDGPLFKASNDPRVTRVGRFLRSSSIDELPQLWNVLLGTMSLVGPRPALPSEVAQFDEDFDRRHSVRPGITGLWQVEARHNPSFNAYRRLDLRYVDNWSLALDLSIMLATGPSVLSQMAHALRQSRRH
jgi:exopolysaccharide biosynthesis polyprenyl glycosylphosphotransferase